MVAIESTRPSVEEGAAQRALRDLMGLLTLPALWLGRDAATVFQLMAESVEHIVALDMTFVEVQALADHPVIRTLRVGGTSVDEASMSPWSESLQALADMPIGAASRLQQTPVGDLNVIRLSMEYSASGGSVWFGSRKKGFPSLTESAILRAAATLAATGLQSARIDHKRASAGRAKDEFLAMLGHELRNPLSPIFAALEIIRRQGDVPLSGPHAVIERQARHLSRLVDDLLDVSRITRGKVELHKEVVSLASILSSALEATGPLMKACGHNIVVTLPDADAGVFGDPTRLVQVFVNLLTNAGKYTPDNGRISLETITEGDAATVVIRDNGVGIDAETMPRLFRIFEQGDGSLDRSRGGLGIGLALVRNLVGLHEGTVRAFSGGLGQGSTFTVTLPLRSAIAGTIETRTPASPSSAPADTRQQQVRVLLVDDNQDALDTMAEVLRLDGIEVAVAAGPSEALEVAALFDPEVALIDIGLPGMHGFDLGKELARRAGLKPLRLISLSGYGLPRDYRDSIAAGFEQHLVKPVDFDQLLALLSAPGAGGSLAS